MVLAVAGRRSGAWTGRSTTPARAGPAVLCGSVVLRLSAGLSAHSPIAL